MMGCSLSQVPPELLTGAGAARVYYTEAATISGDGTPTVPRQGQRDPEGGGGQPTVTQSRIKLEKRDNGRQVGDLKPHQAAHG